MDPFIVFIINTKLDEVSRQDWKQHIVRNESVKVEDLLEFLETKAFELQPTQGERLSRMLKGDCRRMPRKIFAIEKDTKFKLKCTLYSGSYRIRNCKKILSECVKIRTSIVRDLKVCFRCLLKHQFGDYEKDCAHRGGAHHVLLCYKKENKEKQNASGASI